MTVDHPHVRAIAVEPDELVGAFTEALVIVAGHLHVCFEPRKTADSAREASWNRQHLRSRTHPTWKRDRGGGLPPRTQAMLWSAGWTPIARPGRPASTASASRAVPDG